MPRAPPATDRRHNRRNRDRGTIEIERLQNVLYVGRPIVGSGGGTVELFRLEPDGAYAARVSVSFGRASVNVIEIREGLREADKERIRESSEASNSQAEEFFMAVAEVGPVEMAAGSPPFFIRSFFRAFS